jgi:hypothetical protein
MSLWWLMCLPLVWYWLACILVFLFHFLVQGAVLYLGSYVHGSSVIKDLVAKMDALKAADPAVIGTRDEGTVATSTSRSGHISSSDLVKGNVQTILAWSNVDLHKYSFRGCWLTNLLLPQRLTWILLWRTCGHYSPGCCRGDLMSYHIVWWMPFCCTQRAILRSWLWLQKPSMMVTRYVPFQCATCYGCVIQCSLGVMHVPHTNILLWLQLSLEVKQLLHFIETKVYEVRHEDMKATTMHLFSVLISLEFSNDTISTAHCQFNVLPLCVYV